MPFLWSDASGDLSHVEGGGGLIHVVFLEQPRPQNTIVFEFQKIKKKKTTLNSKLL